MEPGITLIDLALEPLLALARNGRKVRLVVVISTNRGMTIDYLHKYANLLDIVFTFQTSYRSGLLDAIEAAADLCVGPTILVLPDLGLVGPGVDERFDDLLTALRTAPCAVIAARESDPDKICQGGALEIVDHPEVSVIVRAEEKPAARGEFGAIWGVIGVADGEQRTLLSIYRTDAGNPMLGAPALFVDGLNNHNFPPSTDAPRRKAAV
jgi:hypothetical protein